MAQQLARRRKGKRHHVAACARSCARVVLVRTTITYGSTAWHVSGIDIVVQFCQCHLLLPACGAALGFQTKKRRVRSRSRHALVRCGAPDRCKGSCTSVSMSPTRHRHVVFWLLVVSLLFNFSMHECMLNLFSRI
jgi:hypothetical protein